MSKNTFFTGQPIFSQLINLIPKGIISGAVQQHRSDYYTKKFDTHAHLITMLFVIYKGCTSLREVEMGMSLCHQKLNHFGLNYVPARSTLSEANMRRDSEVFATIHQYLYKRLRGFLPDSRKSFKQKELYIVDSTTISLFQQIMGTVGNKPSNGQRKGGFKVHTLMRADEDVPRFIRIGKAASNDSTFLKVIKLPPGSILTFDKGYVNYTQYHRFSQEGVSIVTRLRDSACWTLERERPVSITQQSKGVLEDSDIILGHTTHKRVKRVKGRLIKYRDSLSGKEFSFFTNNHKLSPLTIAQIYQKRWQVEILFKRLKQNYPLKYFLGDNENAIRIQTWCALIADLLLKVIKSGTKRNWSFSGVVSIVRQHLLEYVNLKNYLEQPERILKLYRFQQVVNKPDLFSG